MNFPDRKIEKRFKYDVHSDKRMSDSDFDGFLTPEDWSMEESDFQLTS